MNSEEITQKVKEWCEVHANSAPYGINVDRVEKENKKRSHWSILAGRARTLDLLVRVYNRNFIVISANQDQRTATSENFISVLNEMAKVS